VSEVIEEFIRRNPGSREPEAFERFLQEPRIRQWVGDDAGRRERLQREFSRVWENLHAGASSGGASSALATAPRPAAREVHDAPRPMKVEVRPEATARHLHLLCPACARLDVWLQGGVLSCRSCGATYDDMLALVPVKPVGPFEYLFGEGIQGVLTAAAVGLFLLAVYGVLKWL
jgi:hypothetical protein